MTSIGGLLQLIATGIQDQPIINKPEITFFKKVFKKPTDFSICTTSDNLGILESMKENTIVLSNKGDLLYNLFFKVFIKDEDIITQNKTITTYNQPAILKQYDIIYENNYCLLFYNTNAWFIIPEKILLTYPLSITTIKLEPFEESYFITKINNLFYYQINKIVDILWNKFIKSSLNVISLKKILFNIYEEQKNKLFNSYHYNNIIIDNNEITQYFKYINNDYELITHQGFDIDIVYNYCINNFLNFNLYINNTLNNNSKIILIILLLLYSDTNIIFSYWKKYNILNNNVINYNSIILDNSYFNNEWIQNLDYYLNRFLNSTKINNQIFDIFNKNYLLASEAIEMLYNDVQLVDAQNIYIKLKVIFNRFYKLNNNNHNGNRNFNNNYLAIDYSLNKSFILDQSSFNNDNFNLELINEENNYTALINNFDNLNPLDFTFNLTPLDLINIYGLIALDITTNYASHNSFLILWRNCVFLRLYNRFTKTFNITQNNSKLYDLNLNRLFTVYYSIYPNDMFYFEELQNSYYEMFFKNSFIGKWNININTLLKAKENIFNMNLTELQNINLTDLKNKSYLQNKINLQKNNKFFSLEIQSEFIYIIHTFNNTIYSTDLKYITNNVELFNDKLIINYNNYYCPAYFKILLLINNNNYICNNVSLNKTNLIINISNEIYLQLKLNKIFKLIITYNIDLPLVSFYKDNINYPVLIDSTTNIKKLNLSTTFTNSNIYVDTGFHKYAVSFIYTSQGNVIETDLDYITTIYIDDTYIVNITLPFLPNNFYNGINIYRTTSSNLTFYLLTTITNNLDNQISYLDNISDSKLVKSTNVLNNNIKKEDKINKLNLLIIYKKKIKFDINYTSSSKLSIGKYKYLIDNHEITTIYVNTNQIINIYIQEPNCKIYRTKINGNIFYELSSLNIVDLNTVSNYKYIDNISDDLLIIPYNYVLNSGFYSYALTFFNNNEDETLLDYITSIYVNEENINISNLPIDPNNYKFRNIYRTNVNDSTFLLLKTINNIDNNFLDTFNIPLTIPYTNYKQLNYTILDDTNYKIINNNFVFNNYNPNYLYYIYYNNNYQTHVKLLSYKKNIPYDIEPFSIEKTYTLKSGIFDIAINKTFIINNKIYKTDYLGNFFEKTNIIANDSYLISQDNNLTNNDQIIIDNTNYYLINDNYYYINITNSLQPYNFGLYTYNETELQYEYNNIPIITITTSETLSITSNFNFISYNNQLYNFTNNNWVLYIKNINTLNSDDTFFSPDYYYYNITDNKHYYLHNNLNLIYNFNEYKIIFASTDLLNIGYIIDSPNILKYRENIMDEFSLPTGKFLIKINDFRLYNNTFVTVNNGNITIDNKITIETSKIEISGNFYSNNNKLYLFINGSWDLCKQKVYYDSINTKYIYVDALGIISNITILDDNFIINSNMLFDKYSKINYTSGYYLLLPEQILYNIIPELFIQDVGINFIKPLNYNIINNNLYINNQLQTQGIYVIDGLRYQITIVNSLIQITEVSEDIVKFENGKLLYIIDNVLRNFKYKISFINKDTLLESHISNYITTNNTENNNFYTKFYNLSKIYDNSYNGWNIYRTVDGGDIYYLVTTILNSINTNVSDFVYIDKTLDITLIKKKHYQDILYPSLELQDNSTYSIVKIPFNNIAPNLHSFISHSTNVNFMNKKEIPDSVDYIFNKPFIMLARNENNVINNEFKLLDSLNSSYLYFYNIPFIINNTSIIKLNNIKVNYQLPLDTSQFFIKDTPYYKIVNDNIITVNDNEVIDLSFNPSAELIFNSSTELILNSSTDLFLNSTINNYWQTIISALDNNNNYTKYINLINNTNDSYLSIFKNIINEPNLFGLTTTNYILPYINNLLIYNNYDYDKYSHYSLNSYVYQTYSGNNKITLDISNYLINISNYFTNLINNINNNLNTLEYYNPNNYSDQTDNFNQIIYKEKVTNLNLLHPIIDTKIDQIKYKDIIYEDVLIENNTLIVNNFNEYIQKNDYYKIIDNDEKKFKYIGLINLNNLYFGNYFLDNNIIIKDLNFGQKMMATEMISVILYKTNKFYYKLKLSIDSNDKITILLNNSFIELSKVDHFTYEIYSDTLINFPLTIVHTDKQFTFINNIKVNNIFTLSCNYFSEANLEKYKYYTLDNIIFYQTNGINHLNIDSDENNIIITLGNFIDYYDNIYYKFDNNIISNDINYIPFVNATKVALLDSQTLNVVKKTIFYYKLKLFINYDIDNFTKLDNFIYEIYSYTLLNDFIYYYNNKYDILKIDKIIDFKEYNYTGDFNSYYNLNSSNTTWYYTIDNEIFYELTHPKYIIINSTNDNINITLCNFSHNLSNIPTNNNKINMLYETNPNYYILCCNQSNIKILQIKDLHKSIDDNKNYHCWLYEKDELEFIDISNNYPTYSFYKLNNKFYYNENSNLSGALSFIDNKLFNFYELYQLLKINNIENINEHIDEHIDEKGNLITNNIKYKTNFIPTINNTCCINYNKLPNVGTLDNFNSKYIILSLDQDMIIDNSFNVIINNNNKIWWKLLVYNQLTKETYHTYLKIVNTNLTPQITYPFYLSNLDITLINYKYYLNVKHEDYNNYELKNIDYNSILNIKSGFIYNKIVLLHKYDIYYDIVMITKLYLFAGDIIELDFNKFLVLGLNIFTNYYELKLIKVGNKLTYNYNGYNLIHTFPINKINNLKSNAISKFYTNITVSSGTSFYKNNIFEINLIDNINLTDVFINELIKITLFCSNNHLFIFDAFINIEIGDILIYENNQYEVIYIRDNQVFITGHPINLSDNFIEFYLVYDSLKKNQFQYNYYLNPFYAKFDITYLSNDYPIKINVQYYSEDSIISDLDLSLLNIYYYQPVYLNGYYNYIISITKNIIQLKNKISQNGSFKLILSPVFNYSYFINNKKINYNKKISIINEDNKYIQYDINNNTINSISISYSYNNNYINFKNYVNTDNYNLNINSYHLLVDINNKIYLVQIIQSNKFKVFLTPKSYNVLKAGPYLLDNLFTCIINEHYEFTLDINILQKQKLININNNLIQIIKKYHIKIITYLNNEYKINFIYPNNIVNCKIYNEVYINNNSYQIRYDKTTKYYYILSNTILEDFTEIYTININWIKNTIDNTNNSKFLVSKDTNNHIIYINDEPYLNLNNIPSNTTSYYIKPNNDNIYLVQTVNYQLVNNNIINILKTNTNNFRLSLIDYKYFIHDLNNSIININNNKATLTNSLNNIESSTTLINFTNLYMEVGFINNNRYNADNNYQLDLYNIILDKSIFLVLKPWKTWTLLSYNYNLKNIALEKKDFNINQIYNSNYYITEDEIISLSNFLLNEKHFIKIKLLEELLHKQILIWIQNIFFFFNVKNIINDFINSTEFNMFYFNGNELVYQDNQSIVYISNEFIFDDKNKIVYRDLNNLKKVLFQINEYITTGTINDIFFGISINNLLNYLYNLGEQLINFKYINFNNNINYTVNINEIVNNNIFIDRLYNDNSNISNIEIFPSHINYSSTINYNDFYILNESIEYKIENIKFKGLLFTLNFNLLEESNSLITNLSSGIIFYNNKKLEKTNEHNYIIYINNLDDISLQYDSNSGIFYDVSIYFDNNKTYINFKKPIIYKPYLTLIKIYGIKYFLYALPNNKYYIKDFSNNKYYNNIYIELIYVSYELFSSSFELINNINVIFGNFETSKLYINLNDINLNNLDNIIEINGIDYKFINNTYFEILDNNINNSDIILKLPIVFNIENNLNNKYYIILPDFIYINNNTLIKILDKFYILNYDNIGYYIDEKLSNVKFKGFIKTLEFNNSKQYLDINYISLENSELIIHDIKLQIYKKYILKYDGRYYIEEKCIEHLININIINTNNIYYGYICYKNIATISNFVESRQYLNLINLNNIVEEKYILINDNYYLLSQDSHNNYYFITSNQVDYKSYTTNIKQIIPSLQIINLNQAVYEITVSDDVSNNLLLNYNLDNLIQPNNVNVINTNSLLLFFDIKYKEYIDDNKWANLNYINSLNHTFINPIISIDNNSINLLYSYQYDITNNFYIYTQNHNKYFYILNKNDNEEVSLNNNDGLLLNNTLILYYNNKQYVALIYSNKYIISLNEKINDLSTGIIYKINNKFYFSNKLKFYQNNLNLVKFQNQNSLSNININENNIFIGQYLVSYKDFQIINKSYDKNFKQLLKINKKSFETINTIISKPSISHYSKILKYIKLYFNDQLIEELNEYTFEMNYNLYSSDEKKKQINKLTKISNVNDGYQIYIPLLFWFNNNSTLAIPTVSLQNTNIKLVYKSSFNYDINIELITEFIILNNEERKLFGTLNHEYIIQTFKTYPNDSIYPKENTFILDKNLTGLVKDIYIITDPDIYINYNNDSRYESYINAYNNYINNCSYNETLLTSLEEQEYNTLLINLEEQEYLKYISTENKSLFEFNRINRLLNNFPKNLIKFLMYLEDKYLSTNFSNQKKNQIIFIYLKYQFCNKEINEQYSQISSIIMRANGKELFSERDYLYYNYVIPYTKFKTTLPVGRLIYSFSLNPLDEQFSGHLNYTNFDNSEIVLKTKNNKFFNLQIIVKEYNILKIMSGFGTKLFY